MLFQRELSLAETVLNVDCFFVYYSCISFGFKGYPGLPGSPGDVGLQGAPVSFADRKSHSVGHMQLLHYTLPHCYITRRDT